MPTSICPIENSIVVKVEFNGHIRKVLAQPLNLSELIGTVKRLFAIDIKTNDGRCYGLKYRDSEGDWISIFDDSDLEVAFALLRQNEAFRVLVFELPSSEFPEINFEDMGHSGNSVPTKSNHMVDVSGLNTDEYPLFPNSTAQAQPTCGIGQFNGPILPSVDAVPSSKLNFPHDQMENVFVSQPVRQGTLDVSSNRLVDTSLRDDSFGGYPKIEKAMKGTNESIQISSCDTAFSTAVTDLKSSLFQNLFSQPHLQTAPGNFEMSYSTSLSGLAPPQPNTSVTAQREMQEQLQYLKNDIFGSPSTPQPLPGYPASISDYPSTISGVPPQQYSREAFASPPGQVTSYEQASFPHPVSSYYLPPSTNAQVFPPTANQQQPQQVPYMPTYQTQGIIPPPTASGFSQQQFAATRPSSAFQGFITKPTKPSNPPPYM